MNVVIFGSFIVIGLALVGVLVYLIEGELPEQVRKARGELAQKKFKREWSDAFKMYYSPPASENLVNVNHVEAITYIKKLENRCTELELRIRKLESKIKVRVSK